MKTSISSWDVRHVALARSELAVGVASAQIGSTPPTIQDGTIGRGDPHATQLRLTETQKSAIADAVRTDNKAVEPSMSFVASVGAPVPPAIELYHPARRCAGAKCRRRSA